MKEFPNFVFMKRWTMIAKDNVNIFHFLPIIVWGTHGKQLDVLP